MPIDKRSPDVSIIYVNWNSQEEILKSVETIREKNCGLNYEIIVVDNDSAQGTAQLEGAPDVHLIKHSRNAGFGAGCNIGAAAGSGKYFFFFNPDTRMNNNATKLLYDYLDAHPEVGAAGPKVLDCDGEIHFGAARSFHSLLTEFLEHSTLTFRHPKGRVTGKPYYSYWDHDSTRPVDSLIGAAMMFRREVFEELGGFDEDYFLYCEEVDLCHRAWDAGHPVHYVHEAVITHLEKHSANQYFNDFHALVLQHLHSLHLYMLKHYGPLHGLAWRTMIIILYGLKALKNKNRRYLDYCRFGWKLV